MNNNLLIVGATSDIAQATAHVFAAKGYNVALAGRNQADLSRIANDLTIRYSIRCATFEFEATNYESHERLLMQVEAQFGELKGILACYGYLGNQQLGQEQFHEARKIVEINFLSYVSLLNAAASLFVQRKSGMIGAISSVAGDRGRQSNYLYGSAKGALSLYLQGLRNRLSKHGVAVTTIKPGFVDTKMTFGAEGMFLVAKPETVARGIYTALLKRKNTMYLPGFWYWIMLIIRNIPEKIFKKMSL